MNDDVKGSRRNEASPSEAPETDVDHALHWTVPPKTCKLHLLLNCTDDLFELPPLAKADILTIVSGPRLKTIQKLTDGLQALILIKCPLLEQLPPLPATLRLLEIVNCDKLTQLPPLHDGLTVKRVKSEA